MDVKQVAAELSVSAMTVHSWIQSGELPAVDIGTGKRSFWRIQATDLEQFIDRRREKTARRFGAAS